MSKVVIKFEDVSKQYRLGVVSTGTLSHDLNRFIAKVRGKEDPSLKIGSTNTLDSVGDQYVWALQNINFQVTEGEVVGLIGKNGAGKSTLLKLLSKVTAPTSGNIKINGRIASLLEVGTGFHPELTGKENIFLNGAILGMTKKEINLKFDEIVEFSGIKKYVNTPVKRYSSGMYVRLAFAVAAHLEPEILIVDEVLAVGDADFQRKALGKMDEVSKNGRTVLFVSHDMGAIRRLCKRSVLLSKGSVEADGKTDEIIDHYLSDASNQVSRMAIYGQGLMSKSEDFLLKSIRIVDENNSTESILTNGKPVLVKVNYEVLKEIRSMRIIVQLFSTRGDEIFYTSDFVAWDRGMPRAVGKYESICEIPANFLNAHKYYIRIMVDIPKERVLISQTETISFTISELEYDQMGISLGSLPKGLIHPNLNWKINQL
ncbi:MAG: ATP-binding cassette domain-containing protein [Lentimicrobiaceae bacterium]|nr:ATP-binding cassette domain-containing protein [Lentimicrobiaceae bacterium]MCB9023390.1 ATP-binding cassette domain-containing protein [Lentimicrobiaceae bacterium]MCO5266187.1 polysaccharide ABC transporter ATP-binding protein [Lentimicrobium sp.]